LVDVHVIGSANRRGRRIKCCPQCGLGGSGGLTYFRDIPAYVCLNCSYVDYIQEETRPEEIERANKYSEGLRSIDGLSDQQPRRDPSKGVWAKNYGDPRKRSRYYKEQNKPEYDQEIQDYSYNTGARIVSYSEHIPQSDGEVVSREELREREKQ
jgi:hypothetical protein